MKIKDIIADTMAKKDNEPYQIDFPMFVQHMAAILVYVSARAAKTDVPAVCLGGDVLGGGKGKTKVCETDLVDILTGRDLVRRRIVITQLSRFLEWLVEQEKNPADNDPAWCDFEYIAEKWKEFADGQKCID